MRKTLLIAASLCLGVSSSYACEFQRSANAEKATVDRTVVASIAVPQSEPASIPDTSVVKQPVSDVPAK